MEARTAGVADLLVSDASTASAVPPDRYLSSAEVAELLQVSEKTVEEMARRGELPAKKVARFWRYDPRLIAAWFVGDEA